MKLFRKLICFLLAAVVFIGMAPGVFASESADAYARQMIRAYRSKEAGALDTIDALLASMAETDRDKAKTWRGIMDSWDWINREMEINADVLPDGLTQEDALAIVVMGYSLNSDGTMKQELIGRLQVALRSAEKYPNAYIVCTGGATSDNGITEAGAMAAWLIRNGVDQDRVITEAKAMSTSQNAKNVYRLLRNHYPQVQNVAVITSDYHMKRSCLVMSAMSSYAQGYQNGEPLKLVANAAYITGESSEDVFTQAQALADVVNIRLDSGTAKSSAGQGAAASGIAAQNQPASSIRIQEQDGGQSGGITVNGSGSRNTGSGSGIKFFP